MTAPVNFTPAQQEYIGNTIKLAITKMELKVGAILGQGQAMQDEIKKYVEKHNAELHDSANRVITLVEQANAAQQKLEGSTSRIDDSDAKISKAEQVVTDLMEKLRAFETNQMSVFEDHKAQLTKLNSDTETAVQGLDGKLEAAVAGTRAVSMLSSPLRMTSCTSSAAASWRRCRPTSRAMPAARAQAPMGVAAVRAVG